MTDVGDLQPYFYTCRFQQTELLQAQVQVYPKEAGKEMVKQTQLLDAILHLWHQLTQQAPSCFLYSNISRRYNLPFKANAFFRQIQPQLQALRSSVIILPDCEPATGRQQSSVGR